MAHSGYYAFRSFKNRPMTRCYTKDIFKHGLKLTKDNNVLFSTNTAHG